MAVLRRPQAILIFQALLLLGSICISLGDNKVSVCPNTCHSGACCEVQQNNFLCCPYENGVCCEDGKHCCPQGSTCDAKVGKCYSPLSSVVFPTLQITEPFDLNAPKPPQEQFVICPDRESTCDDSMTCCKMKNDTYGCCKFEKGVCCSDGLHCCPEGSVCDLQHSKCTLPPKSPNLPESLFRAINAPKLAQARLNNYSSSSLSLMAYETIQCPGSSFECPSGSTCCPTDSDFWTCCPEPEAVCCSDKSHCCPKHYTCNLETQQCVLNQQFGEPVSSLSELVSTVPQPVQCPDTKWECPKNTTCCQLLDKTWGCCDSPSAVCCSDGLHCCPANSVCDLTKSSCILSSGNAIPAIAHTLPQLPSSSSPSSKDQICNDGDSICRNGTCCQTKSGKQACCPHVQAVCCPDGEHCCPKEYQCDASTGSCLAPETNFEKSNHLPLPKPLHDWLKKSSILEKVITNKSNICRNGKYLCSEDTTCCPVTNDIWTCCPFANAVCCSDHLHCCPNGYQCDIKGKICVPEYQTTNQPMIQIKLTSSPPPLGKFCPDHEAVCEDDQTCCTLADNTWSCCPLNHGVCCSDHLHCCPQNTVCLPDSSGCVPQLSDRLRKLVVVPASKMTQPPSRPSMLMPSDTTDTTARWCGICGDQGCCMNVAGAQPPLCCPYMNGVCCPDGKFCCPHNSRCLPNGQCESGTINDLVFFAPSLIPSKSAKSKSSSVPTTLAATPADWDVLLRLTHYRELRQVHNTICPDNLHFCGDNQKCCPSVKYGYTCVPEFANCCSEMLNTYCPPAKSCSSDGRSCL